MAIERVIIKNYRTLADTDIRLRPGVNIVVGDNESGKSTLLEAINLALKCQINRRSAAFELHPFLFNTCAVTKFIDELRKGQRVPPPEILIELYFSDRPELADLKGTNNSLREDAPGLKVVIRLDESYGDEYRNYINDPEAVTAIPIEYYEVVWESFSGEFINPRMLPFRSSIIDPSSISNTYVANKYVVEFTRDYLTKPQQVSLALSYRKLRDRFGADAVITKINDGLLAKKGIVSDKVLTIGMDMTAKSAWEAGVSPHLDSIPMALVGKGEQSTVKIKLAMESDKECDIVLIEEPENHLSHSNLNRLLSHLYERATDKQLIITTHSSFVLNKLGVDGILMFNGKTGITLSNLSPSTKEYFRKVPGHDTLRMILGKKTILVEGPSDELIVLKAFLQKYRKTPLEMGVEVISVSLAFKRFLEIAKILQLQACVVTDNDGDADAVASKFSEYADLQNIRICYSKDNNLRTLEPQMLSANGRERLNSVFKTAYVTDKELMDHMIANKTDCALAIVDSEEAITIPKYIQDAISQ